MKTYAKTKELDPIGGRQLRPLDPPMVILRGGVNVHIYIGFIETVFKYSIAIE